MPVERQRAHRFMFPLPLRPTFPVFGLSTSYTGFRWLVVWQRTDGPERGELSEVALGHGHPDDGPFVAVDTTLKQPARGVGEWSIGPVDLGFASFKAVAGMVEQNIVTRDPRRSRREWQSLMDTEFPRIDGAGGRVPFHGWDQEQVELDGIASPGWVRRLERAWGLVIDLPEVVVTASGPIAGFARVPELIDVTSRLGDYAADTDGRADTIIARS